MNILIISDFDHLALEIKDKISEFNHNSFLLTTKEINDKENVANISNFKSKKLIWLKDAIRSLFYRKLLFLNFEKSNSYYQDIAESNSYYSFIRIKERVNFIPDVILILFDYRIITSKTLLDLANWSKAPIFWLMVDMKPMTGGCAYAGQCNKFKTNCKHCPLITNILLKNYAAKQLETKRKLLKGINLTLIAGSSHQKSQAQESSVFKGRPIFKLIFPVNENIFFKGNKKEAKSKLRLHLNKKVILFGAAAVNNERKGFKFLIKALNLLEESYSKTDIVLLVVGEKIPKELKKISYPMIELGYVDQKTLALAYQASDVFVCPTIDDSGPMMVSQAMLCGTPVVGFKMGVCLDLIENYKTGFLCELGNFKEVAAGIKKILEIETEEIDTISNNCVEKAKITKSNYFFNKLEILVQNKTKYE